MLEEAANIFTHLGVPVNSTTVEQKIYYGTNYKFESGLSIRVVLPIQDDIVKNVEVSISPEKSQPGIPREWLAYSPETLINRYGIPSKLDFSVDRIRDANVPQRTWYHMFMYFEPVDLIAEYAYGEIFPETMFQVCPLIDQYDLVRVWLGEHPESPPFEHVPLEEATTLTMEAFAELMLGEPEEACFELKVDIFP